jgi:hypothetical protein
MRPSPGYDPPNVTNGLVDAEAGRMSGGTLAASPLELAFRRYSMNRARSASACRVRFHSTEQGVEPV